MPFPRAADHADALAHFGAEDVPERSCYRYAPVFPCLVDGRRAVVKRTRRTAPSAAAIAGWTTRAAAAGVPVVWPLPSTADNPVAIGDEHWVAYPFVEGDAYTGTDEQIALAGDLLGRLHAVRTDVTAPPFSWPDPDPDSIAEDRDGIRDTVGRHSPESAERLCALVEEFPTAILPRVRDAGLPTVSATMDFKANNLVYGADGPVLVDPDNADHAPRLLDLALAALQFHVELPTAPASMFDRRQWSLFLDGYRRHVELTDAEHDAWPIVVDYMLSEFGVWSLVESDDWDDPRERRLMLDLAAATADRFPLG